MSKNSLHLESATSSTSSSFSPEANVAPSHASDDLGHSYYQRYLNHLHGVKQSFLGYPCSPFTDENRQSILHTISSVTINNVGDPYDETGHWKTHSKRFEREVIDFFAHLFDFGKTLPSADDVKFDENDIDEQGLLPSERVHISALESIATTTSDSATADDNSNPKENTRNCWGYISSGGTEGNLQGMYVGRNYLRHKHRKELQRSLPVVFIASKASHYSIKKNADILDMDYYEIKVNDKDEMDMPHLEEVLNSFPPDQAIVFNLNVGTTMKGAIDPIESIVELVDKSNRTDYVYLHSDMALYGLIYRFFHNYDQRIFKYRVHSFSISGHKLLTCPMPCGIFLVKSEFLNVAFRNATNEHHSANIERISYIGCHDNTISGSRNGLLPLLIHAKISKGVKYLKEEVNKCIENADFLYKEMIRRRKPARRSSEAGIIIYFPSPSEIICDKYQLACSEGWSHIVCMPHVTRHMLTQFLQDYQNNELSIGFRAMEEVDIEKCVNCVTANFVDRETLTNFQGITYEEFVPFITAFVKKGLGTSIVAYDTRLSDLQNNVVGCTISVDHDDEVDVESLNISEKFTPIMKILDEVHFFPPSEGEEEMSVKTTSFKAFSKQKKSLHLCNVAVDAIYAGKGYANMLIEKNIELAKRLGYEEMFVETTAPGSLKASLNAGFKVNHSIKVHEFSYEDEVTGREVYPFKELESQSLSVSYLTIDL